MADEPDTVSLKPLQRMDAKLEDAIGILDRSDVRRHMLRIEHVPPVGGGKVESAMVTLDLEADVLEKLREMARRNTLTVEQQAKMLLEQSVRQALSAEHRADIARRIASMTPKGVEQTDSTELLREDRLR